MNAAKPESMRVVQKRESHPVTGGSCSRNETGGDYRHRLATSRIDAIHADFLTRKIDGRQFVSGIVGTVTERLESSR